jgi:PAS domain S-box-containing protein
VKDTAKDTAGQDADKSREQLVQEVAALRRRLSEKEAREAKHRRVESQQDAMLETPSQQHDLVSRLLETSPAGITMVDRTGQIMFANARAEQVLGLRRTEVIGRAYDAPTWHITDYDGQPFPAEQLPFTRVLATGRPVYDVRHAIEWPDGRRVLLSINAAPMFDPSGQVDGVVAAIEDVSERVRATEALLKSERRMRAIVEAAPFGAHLYELQPDGRLVFVGANRSADQILGVDHRQFVGKTIEEAFPALTSTPIPAAYRQVAATGERYDHEQVDYDEGGILGAFEIHASQTDVNRMAVFFRDITERKRTEDAMRQQAETLAALHETALELAAQRSLPDLLRAIVVRAIGLLKASGCGFYLYREDSDDLELVLTVNQKPDFTGAVLRRGEGLSGKILVSRRPLVVTNYGDWEGKAKQYAAARFAAVIGVPILWGDRLLGVVNVTDDTPRSFSAADVALLERFAPLAAAALENHRLVGDVQAQMDKLKRAQMQLIQAAKLAAVGELAAGVAHELNNPLTSVLGFTELLLHTPTFDDRTRADLETVASQARRARDIVRNLLDFARQTKPQRLPADVADLLHRTLELIRRHLEGSGVAIEEEYAPDIGLLDLDSGQMRQVFLNLISNAAQAMPRGGKLKLRIARQGDEVAISVSDTGYGIPPEVHDRIFDPFFTTKPAGQGTGLGLPISLGIVQEHGGRISVESQVGQGSTFTIWLPAG